MLLNGFLLFILLCCFITYKSYVLTDSDMHYVIQYGPQHSTVNNIYVYILTLCLNQLALI